MTAAPTTPARIAVTVPSLNQGAFIGAALDSIRECRTPLVCAVLDGGSTDSTSRVLADHASHVAYVRSHPDDGQAAAVNEGIAWLIAHAPSVDYVTWLNADDTYIDDGLSAMATALDAHPDWVAVSARAVVTSASGSTISNYPTAPFDRARFTIECTICQPATLVRRRAWEELRGLDASLDMCFDYDLWWRLARLGQIGHLDVVTAASRDHGDTKTRRRRERYFTEARHIVWRETGRVPWHWYISEAIEREGAFVVGHRPPPVAMGRAAARAAARFCRDRFGAAQ